MFEKIFPTFNNEHSCHPRVTIIMRIFKKQKVINFFLLNPNLINKKMIYIKSKLIENEHNFIQTHLACKKTKIPSQITFCLIFLKCLLMSIQSVLPIIKFLIANPFIKIMVINKLTFLCLFRSYEFWRSL